MKTKYCVPIAMNTFPLLLRRAALCGCSSGFDIARLSDPLIVEAMETHVPDPGIDGGERVFDDRLPWRSNTESECTSSAIGQEGEETSVAAGQAGGGSASSGTGIGESLSLPGLNINWPFSQFILAGLKLVETRKYALGYKNIAQPDVEMWLVETRGRANALARGWVLDSGAAVAPRPEDSQRHGDVLMLGQVREPRGFRSG